MTLADRTTSDPEQTDRILRQRARTLARRGETGGAVAEPCLLLRVGDHRLALPAARARHVLPTGPVAVVPGVAAAVRGVTCVMGELVPVVELRALVDATTKQPRDGRQLVVVDDGDHPLGLEVDGVETIVDLQIDEASSAGRTPGDLTCPLRGGLRLLVLDALLNHPHMASGGDPLAEDPGGNP